MENKTVEKIIQTAIDMIAGNGYHNTSIKSITSKLGITQPAIYAHFENKAEIAIRIAKMYESGYIENLIRIVNDPSDSALDKLHKVISWGAEFVIKHPNLIIAYIALKNELKEEPIFHKLSTGIEDRYVKTITKLYRLGLRQGHFNNTFNVKVLTHVHIATTVGMFYEWRNNGGRLNGEEFIRTFRTIIFKGIEASGGSVRAGRSRR